MAPQSDMILQENEGLPCEEKKQELPEEENEMEEPEPQATLFDEKVETTEAEAEAEPVITSATTTTTTSSTTTERVEEEEEGNRHSMITFDETSIQRSQSKPRLEQETENVGSAAIQSSIDDDDDDDEAHASPLVVDTTAASTACCLEPEGATPIVRENASRRFSDDMLQKVMADAEAEAGEEPETEAATGASTVTQTETETQTNSKTETKTTTPVEKTVENRIFIPHLEPTGTMDQDKNDASGETTTTTSRKKPKEPPGSPAKRQRSRSALTSPVRSDKDSTDGIIVINNNDGDGDGTEPTTLTLNQTQTETKTCIESGTTSERQLRSQSTPSKRKQRPADSEQNTNTRTSNQNHIVSSNSSQAAHPPSDTSHRLTPISMSSDFFLDDHHHHHQDSNSNSTPIPHLPPLIVPRVGSDASYDNNNNMSSMPMPTSTSMQGLLSQPSHSHFTHNHNGYPKPFPTRPSFGSHQQQQQQQQQAIPHQVATMPGGKRKIHLQLWEDVSSSMSQQQQQPPPRSSFLSFRRKKGKLRKHSMESSSSPSPLSDFGSGLGGSNSSDNNNNHWANRGSLTISWYEGTSSLELQEHVQNSVVRKLGLSSTSTLLDFRVLDESFNPPEEIVLSPYIPDGSRLTLRFATSDGSGYMTPPKYTRFSDYDSGPPDSPSAAPSPRPTSLDLNGLGLNANQLALLGTRLNSLQVPLSEGADSKNRGKLLSSSKSKNGRKLTSSSSSSSQPSSSKTIKQKTHSEKKSSKDGGGGTGTDNGSTSNDDDDNNSKESSLEVASLHPEDQIQKSLREITTLLLQQQRAKPHYVPRLQEKRQVVFVLANYFVLFLSLIAISAEIQARAPGWHAAMEQQLMNVQDCSKDKESLFQCVENGDMAGLVASVILWMSRSAATKRIFLFGFSSPQKLWTAVYESLVTSFCWGFSYMFIRRGMNPDNNRDFLRRYWKDAVYGSLAGFNAAFMKQVLKNLIPQEVIEDALQERQLKILSWLPSLKQREN